MEGEIKFQPWKRVKRVDGGREDDIRRQWLPWLKRFKHDLRVVPPCCETCRQVGGAMWHCMNHKSPKYGINVMPCDLCAQYELNMGLMFFLCNAQRQI